MRRLVITGVALGLSLILISSIETSRGQTGSLDLSGYAWGGNGVGWLSLRNPGGGISYGVTMNTGDGTLSGYAWNSNIGWIKFDPNWTGFPVASDQWGAKMNLSTGAFTGWARACAVFQNGCDGSLKPSSSLGNWDGWIKFAGSVNPSGIYGAFADSASNPTQFTDSSYSWGGDGYGWLRFCDSGGSFPYCVRFAGMTASCSVSPSPANFPLDSSNNSITWRVITDGGSPDYSYSWTGDIGHNSAPTPLDIYDYISSESCGSSDSTTVKQGYMTVTDGAGAPAYCQTSVTINCSDSYIPPVTGGDLSSPTPPVIRITSQPISSPAISSATTFWSQDQGVDTTAFIVSTKSLVDNKTSLDQYSEVGCRLSETAAGPSSTFGPCSGATINLWSNHGNEANFNIKVDYPPPLTLNLNSPYKIIVSASSTCITESVECGNAVRSFLFDYAVGSVTPI